MTKPERDPRAGKYFITWREDGEGQRRIERQGRVIEAAGDMYLVEFFGEWNSLGLSQDFLSAADLEGASLFASSTELDAVVRGETRKAAGK